MWSRRNWRFWRWPGQPHRGLHCKRCNRHKFECIILNVNIDIRKFWGFWIWFEHFWPTKCRRWRWHRGSRCKWNNHSSWSRRLRHVPDYFCRENTEV